ncbi:MAG: DUF1127 domain-containing protein [Roseobacter sp.]
MSVFKTIRQYAARRALEREIYSELSQISDAELNDLNLSRAKISEMSRQFARAV